MEFRIEKDLVVFQSNSTLSFWKSENESKTKIGAFSNAR